MIESYANLADTKVMNKLIKFSYFSNCWYIRKYMLSSGIKEYDRVESDCGLYIA